MRSGPRFTIGNYYGVHTNDGKDIRVLFTGRDEAPFVADNGDIFDYENIDVTKGAEEFGPRTSGPEGIM